MMTAYFRDKTASALMTRSAGSPSETASQLGHIRADLIHDVTVCSALPNFPPKVLAAIDALIIDTQAPEPTPAETFVFIRDMERIFHSLASLGISGFTANPLNPLVHLREQGTQRRLLHASRFERLGVNDSTKQRHLIEERKSHDAIRLRGWAHEISERTYARDMTITQVGKRIGAGTLTSSWRRGIGWPSAAVIQAAAELFPEVRPLGPPSEGITHKVKMKAEKKVDPLVELLRKHTQVGLDLPDGVLAEGVVNMEDLNADLTTRSEPSIDFNTEEAATAFSALVGVELGECFEFSVGDEIPGLVVLRLLSHEAHLHPVTEEPSCPVSKALKEMAGDGGFIEIKVGVSFGRNGLWGVLHDDPVGLTAEQIGWVEDLVEPCNTGYLGDRILRVPLREIGPLRQLIMSAKLDMLSPRDLCGDARGGAQMVLDEYNSVLRQLVVARRHLPASAPAPAPASTSTDPTAHTGKEKAMSDPKKPAPFKAPKPRKMELTLSLDGVPLVVGSIGVSPEAGLDPSFILSLSKSLLEMSSEEVVDAIAGDNDGLLESVREGLKKVPAKG